MFSTDHFDVFYVVPLLVAQFFEGPDEVEGVVDGVDDTVVVAVGSFVTSAGLEPKAERAAVPGPFHHFLGDAVGIGVTGFKSFVPPPEGTGKNPGPEEKAGVVPGQVESG